MIAHTDMYSAFGFLHCRMDESSDVSEKRTVSIFKVSEMITLEPIQLPWKMRALSSCMTPEHVRIAQDKKTKKKVIWSAVTVRSRRKKSYVLITFDTAPSCTDSPPPLKFLILSFPAKPTITCLFSAICIPAKFKLYLRLYSMNLSKGEFRHFTKQIWHPFFVSPSFVPKGPTKSDVPCSYFIIFLSPPTSPKLKLDDQPLDSFPRLPAYTLYSFSCTPYLEAASSIRNLSACHSFATRK